MSYRVKLDDGSEIGPLDLNTVRTWYREGLIGPATPAQRMGSSRWSTLDKVVDIKRWGATSASQKRAKREMGGEEDEDEGRPGDTPRWRTLLASLVLFVLALGAGAASIYPDRVPVDLDGAPWTEVALGLVIPALLLLKGWELGRRLSRLVLFLGSFALLAAGGALYARQAALETWFLLGALWLVCFGLVAFIARGSIHWLQSALWLVVVGAGLYGIARFGYVPGTVLGAQVAEWRADEGSWVSPVSGWTFEAPPGWVLLREGNPVSPAVDASATLAAPRLGAIAVLWESPAAGGALDRQLDALVERRRQAVPGLELVDRSDDLIGGLELRRGTGRWEREGGAWVERDSVWRDGWLGYSLAAWAPEGGAAQRALVDLEPHPGPEGTLSGRIDTAAAALSAAQPLLSEAAARQALREARTLELTPDAALLRLLAAVARGRGGLSAADADRLEQIETRLEGSVSRSRRAALRAALRGQGDAQSLELLKQATSGLVPEARVYLRELWARAALAQP